MFCQTRAFEAMLKKLNISETSKKYLVKRFFSYLGKSGFTVSAPEAARETSRLIKQLTHIIDPFKYEKESINQYLMKLYPKLEREVETSSNPFDIALRLAIAGNTIDNIANPDFNIDTTINHVLSANFKIDHSSFLLDQIQKAKRILYLGDNAGEIVLDKLFIKTLEHPAIFYAVRGSEVINDATFSDALSVGMNEVTTVISNGSDAPSTILTDVSKRFIDVYSRADLIISKGQGNFEGLQNEKSEKIFFLFMVKCNVIGHLIKAEVGDFVVMNKMNL